MFYHLFFLPHVRIIDVKSSKIKTFKIIPGINELMLAKLEGKQKLVTKTDVTDELPDDFNPSDQHTMEINGVLGGNLHVSYQITLFMR